MEKIELGIGIQTPVKRMIKKVIKHRLGYAPVFEIYCERIKGDKPFPRWTEFTPAPDSLYELHLYHEPYSKNKFMIVVKLYKVGDPIFIEEKIIT